MEILNAFLILVTLVMLRKWYLIRVKLGSLKVDLAEAKRKLGSSVNSCSPYLNHSDLQKVFGNCSKTESQISIAEA